MMEPAEEHSVICMSGSAVGPFPHAVYTNEPYKAHLKLVPAIGYQIEPASTYSNSDDTGDYPPVLYLLTAPGNAPLSYNDTVQVYYHDPSGKKFVAIWFIRYIICVKGETRPTCGDHVSVSS